MALRVVLVRPGESQANTDRAFANHVTLAAGLPLAGIAQAQDLARALEGAGIAHVYGQPA